VPRMDSDVFGTLRVDLDDVRKLELRYNRRTPGKADLFVEYVRGRIKAFEVDRFLIERLLEQLERGCETSASTTCSTPAPRCCSRRARIRSSFRSV